MKECILKRKWAPGSLFFLLFLLIGQALYAQIEVTGKVTDQGSSEGLPGVNVVEDGTTNGTVTDLDGKFKMTVANESSVLVFSYIGYVREEISVEGRSSIDVSLVPDVTQLSEVVVIGYGAVKKSDVTGAVAKVETEKLTQYATVDVNQALQGKVAGVQITPNSGRPGASAKVRVRGIGTINNSDPLYVVDGFPTGSIDFIAPGDIESMEVLKDASATAIYGNRGANGVILITTKKGREGAAKFNFNAYAGVQNPWKTLDVANATEYATLYLEAHTNDGVDVTDPAQFPIADYTTLQYVIDNNYEGTDWQDEVFRKNATLQNYNFSVNGGSEKSRYGVSATYFDQEGTIKNTQMQKFFLRLNNDLKLSDKLNAGFNLSYINVDINNYADDQYSGVLPTAISASPVTRAWDPVAEKFGATQQFSQNNNPARIVDELKYRTWKQNKLVGTMFGEFEIVEDLTFRSNFGGELYFNRSKNYYPEFSTSPQSSEARTVSSLYDGRDEGYGWTWSNYFTYNKTFGVHNLNLMLGTEASAYFNTGVNVTGYKVINDPTQHYIRAAKDPIFQAGSGEGHSSLLSYFGRLNYSYNGKYLVTATVRRDASSRFIKDNRVGIFPSFSLGWNAHEEDFLQGQSIVTNLKLRGGYGEVGNQSSVSSTATQYIVSANQRYSFGGLPVEGRANTRLKNSALIWETSAMTNLGIDAGFLQNKLTLTADYFIKKTSDMIVSVPLPQYIGANAPSANAGDMENRGLELALGYNKKEGDFRFDISANAAFIKNELVNLGGGEPFNSGGVNKLGNTTRIEEGEVLAYFYGLKTDGIFNTPEEVEAYTWTDPETGVENRIQPLAEAGDVKFVDTNNDGKIDDDDRVKLGSAMPDFSYGFSAFLEYKNIDLKIFFQGLYGNETVNSLLIFNENPQGITNSLATRMDRWTPDNPDSNEPRMTSQNANDNSRFSDRYVEDGSYLRLRNIQLGYTIPGSAFGNLGVSNIRVYVSADNLLTFTNYKGYEPEVGDLYSSPFYWGVDLATYPQSSTILGGININF